MALIRGKAAGAIVAGFLATHGHVGLSANEQLAYEHHAISEQVQKRSVKAVSEYLKEHDGKTLMTIRGYQRLAKHEGMDTTPYRDSAGVLTVCFGETKGVENREYSAEECAAMLVLRVEKWFAPETRACTRLWKNLDSETTDALISFSYNTGISAYCGSSVSKRLNKGYGSAACDRMLLWNKIRVNGSLRPLEGLTNRRTDESEWCRNGFG